MQCKPCEHGNLMLLFNVRIFNTLNIHSLLTQCPKQTSKQAKDTQNPLWISNEIQPKEKTVQQMGTSVLKCLFGRFSVTEGELRTVRPKIRAGSYQF